ncbi:MAG TPA: pyridoxal-phosphate dependent enzyme [Acidimicrobiales bacterium]|jgi:threonine synthase|nr:pyridoxal-phosphate dependent enzyme [Acidimicrobiales bacterium]
MNPFVRYRRLLESYTRARVAGMTDARFVELVESLDRSVAGVAGHGFVTTPFDVEPKLAHRVGLDGIELWVKDDTGNIGGSHKGRHLFGLLLHLAIDAEVAGGGVIGAGAGPDLAIASCGNAALAAAVVARAVDRPLHVFIPVDAEPAVVAELERLGAIISVCPRRPGEAGDPAYLAFRDALATGALALSVQGTDAPATIDGGRTIAWEMAEQLVEQLGAPARLDRVFVQVGGGALATAVGRGFVDAVQQEWLVAAPALHAVQTAGAFPLVRAWDLLAERIVADLGHEVPPITSGPDRAHVAGIIRTNRREPAVRGWLDRAAAEPGRFMWPWEDTPRSIATGILDDVTYDWIGVVDAMLHTGGWPVIVDERALADANEAALDATDIAVDPTGSAGLAGVMTCARFDGAPLYGERVAVLFTGVRRA